MSAAVVSTTYQMTARAVCVGKESLSRIIETVKNERKAEGGKREKECFPLITLSRFSVVIIPGSFRAS